MRSLRSPVVGVLLITLATLAACGGGQASTSSAATSSQAAASSAGEPTEAADTPSAAESTGGSGGGDVQAVADALKPPNATQTFNSASGDVILTIYASTDSGDSLKSFYEGAIPAAGLKIISTSTDTASSTTVFVFSRDDNTSFGGGISIGPDPSGNGTVVSVTVGGDQLP